MDPWITEEQQNAGATTIANAGGVSVVVVPARSGNTRRASILITNLTAGASMTVQKGDTPATATIGIPLATKQSYVESDDGGYTCYQGSYQVYSDVAANISVFEMIVPRYS